MDAATPTTKNMLTIKGIYKIPSAGVAREKLREKGQFWTPYWVAEAMVEYILADGAREVFDPAVGAGAFFQAAKKVAKEKHIDVELWGMETDSSVLEKSHLFELDHTDFSRVQFADFIFNQPGHRPKAIVANPPYIRHHRLSSDVKEKLRRFTIETIGSAIDGRAGLHIFFLIRALQLLETDGRLAFIMPADTCEGVFAPTLWRWITRKFCVEAVITFDSVASPFPQVDTNPMIFLIKNAKPNESFFWARCHKMDSHSLKEWIRSGFNLSPSDELTIVKRDLSEGVITGLSRAAVQTQEHGPKLGDFARVMRGIATGANDFFFLTHEQAAKLEIDEKFLITAIGRTRDVSGSEITKDLIGNLATSGRPTLLLSLDDRPLEDFPESLQTYLKLGEDLGLPQKPLIAQRRVWYKMETRVAPPFLFAYLGRRNARFIRNYAGVVPLTCFLCVYPNQTGEEFNEKLWQGLNHPETVRNLNLIGKSYGSGAIKVEPRALEKLPLPEHVVNQAGLKFNKRLF